MTTVTVMCPAQLYVSRIQRYLRNYYKIEEYTPYVKGSFSFTVVSNLDACNILTELRHRFPYGFVSGYSSC